MPSFWSERHVRKEVINHRVCRRWNLQYLLFTPHFDLPTRKLLVGINAVTAVITHVELQLPAWGTARRAAQQPLAVLPDRKGSICLPVIYFFRGKYAETTKEEKPEGKEGLLKYFKETCILLFLMYSLTAKKEQRFGLLVFFFFF